MGWYEQLKQRAAAQQRAEAQRRAAKPGGPNTKAGPPLPRNIWLWFLVVLLVNYLVTRYIVPSEEVLSRIASLGALEPAAGPARGNGPAKYHRIAGAAGSVGVITPMTHTYCGDCNRVRLTADGRLRTCLYGDHEVNLRDPLRRGEALEPLFRQALAEKPLEHNLLQLKVGGLRALSQVGG